MDVGLSAAVLHIVLRRMSRSICRKKNEKKMAEQGHDNKEIFIRTK